MLALTNSPASSIEAAAVWKQEHAYWQAPVNKDNAVYQKLWHPAFLGSPCTMFAKGICFRTGKSRSQTIT